MNYSDEELDKIIEKRISEGWSWRTCCSPIEFFEPPLTHPFADYTASWIPYKGNDKKRYPHWIGWREDE